MITRDAAAADLPKIDRVFRESFCDAFAHLYRSEDLADFLATFTRDAWEEEFRGAGYAFHVAEVEGEVVGYVKLGPSTLPIEADPGAAELRQLYVLKTHHGAGIAAALMDWALAEATRKQHSELLLTVYTDNHRARRFYERYAFEPIGRYAFMVGSQADEDVIMRKRL